MSNVYISSRGQLSKCDEHFIFKDYQGKCISIFPVNTDKLILCNSVSITGEAFYLLSKFKIPITIRTFRNNENISLQYSDDKNVLIKQLQYKALENEEKSLEIAKAIVRGKIKNQLAFIQRIKRTETNKTRISEVVNRIKEILFKIPNCKSLNSLRGLEGLSARYYFSIFDLHIKPEWAIFEKRSKHPPKTNVNAVLSFLYYLLSEEVEFAIQSEGLDCNTGTLHKIQQGRKLLVYDLMEEFRVPFADVLCCRLFNHKILKKDDFIQEDQAIYLTKEGMNKVITEFESKMSQTIKKDDTEFLCRDIVFNQARLYKSVLAAKEEKYIPYKYK